MKKLLLLFFCLLFIFNSCKKEDVDLDILETPSVTTQIILEVYGFENLDGDLAIAINNSSEQFISNTECYRDTIIDIPSNDITLTIEGIIAGTYAISVFHDEDEDGELDLGFLNIPEEGFGFSNNPPIGFSQPDFNDCKFTIEEAQSLTIPILLVYL
ncbi:MAG: DUF2141 domain-containing protein [Bacteroidota bacterium]|nr:DUF2141 domain-containing protein [Bacteroidota bacterium]